MAKFSAGMKALDKILGGSPKEAEAFIRSTLSDSPGVKNATDIVGDMQYHLAKAAGVKGRSKDFIDEIGSLGQYGYSADDGKKLLDAAKNWKPKIQDSKKITSAADDAVYAKSNWLPSNGNTPLQAAQRNIDARAAFKSEQGLKELDEVQARQRLIAEDKARRDAATPSSNMSKADLMNREAEYRFMFNNDTVGARSDYANYGTHLVKKEPVPTAKPATSVADSPAANTKLDDFSGGAGKEEVSTTPKAGEPVPQDAGKTPSSPSKSEFDNNSGAGGGQDPMGSFFEEKLNTKGLTNADRHKFERVQDDYQKFMAETKEAGSDQEKLDEIRNRYGVGANANPVEHFKAKANEDATTMDWVMGNHVPQYAGGVALIGGAVASCFSNKGKMSNSELYGQNF